MNVYERNARSTLIGKKLWADVYAAYIAKGCLPEDAKAEADAAFLQYCQAFPPESTREFDLEYR